MPLLMPLLQLLLLKLHVLQVIVPGSLLPLLNELPIKHWLLQQQLRLAVTQIVKAWNACSRNRCPNSLRLLTASIKTPR
ncbi:MAG: hypothetical protein HQ492_02690 [Woeseiaceae bacterium]|nr:hypothetical protein [Woeseiaceae bacterium]